MSLSELINKIQDQLNEGIFVDALSERHDLTWDLIQTYPALQWSSKALSRLAPLEYIIDHPDNQWNFDEISGRKDLTIEFIKLYKNNLNWAELSKFTDIDIILTNTDLPWSFENVSQNKTVSQDHLLENPDKPWEYSYLAEHIDLEFIKQNPHIKWGVYGLSKNPTLTIDYIQQNRTRGWDWEAVIRNPNISLHDIIENEIQFNAFHVFHEVYADYMLEHSRYTFNSVNIHASLDSINKYPNRCWKYSINKNMTMDYVLEHPEIEWSFMELSKNNKISLQDVLDHWDLRWDIPSIVKYKY